jgi:hypothetical protein
VSWSWRINLVSLRVRLLRGDDKLHHTEEDLFEVFGITSLHPDEEFSVPSNQAFWQTIVKICQRPPRQQPFHHSFFEEARHIDEPSLASVDKQPNSCGQFFFVHYLSQSALHEQTDIFHMGGSSSRISTGLTISASGRLVTRNFTLRKILHFRRENMEKWLPFTRQHFI